MGVVYKLKPEIINFILEIKKVDPKISCRSMAALIENKFQIKVSKSSINAIFKSLGLSQSVGRRRTKRKYTLRIKGVIAAQTKELIAPAAPAVVAAVPVNKPIEMPPPPEVSKPIEMPAPAEEAKAKEEAEEEARREAKEKVRLEAEEKARLEAEAKAKAEEEARAKAEAEEKSRREAEERARKEAEEQAKRETEEKARREAEEKAKIEAEVRAKLEAELKAKLETEQKARQEAEEKARAEAEARARAEQELKAKQEAEEKARLEAEEAKRKAEEEAKATLLKAGQTFQAEGEFQNLGVVFLKAADYLLGGSKIITEAIASRLKCENADIEAKNECLIYNTLFGLAENMEPASDCGLWALTGHKFTQEEISAYISRLQEFKPLAVDLARAVSSISQEVRGIKIILSDGALVYLDGQLHTAWSTVHTPYNFSLPLYNAKNYMNKHLEEGAPLVLFMAPGYETPTKEFFDFISGMEGRESQIAAFNFYGNKFEEIETIRFERMKKRHFIVGIWPWQFAEYRQVASLQEFKPFSFGPQKKEFYSAGLEMDLAQPKINQSLRLRGCALKTSPAEKARLLIFSNIAPEKISPEELARQYLSRWPNMEEAFHDYSRKVELFTYTAASQRFFSVENIDIATGQSLDIKEAFRYYLKVLDLYVRQHFLPVGYESEEMATVNERFYSLKAEYNVQNGHITVNFKPSAGFKYLKELEYTCRRVNEGEVYIGGRRLWLL